MPARRDEFRNADQIVGDQIEQKVSGDAANAAMLGLAQGAVLFTPAKDALDHRAACLRFRITGTSGRASVDGAAPPSVLVSPLFCVTCGVISAACSRAT